MNELKKENILASIIGVLIVVGLFGNSLNIIVLSRKSMRIHSTFRLLLYSSIIDIFVILVSVMDVFLIFAFNIEIRNYSSFICSFILFNLLVN